jgi:hypothetical protein
VLVVFAVVLLVRLVPVIVLFFHLRLFALGEFSYDTGNGLLFLDVIVADVADGSKDALHAVVQSSQIGEFSLADSERFSGACAGVLFGKGVAVVGPEVAVEVGEGRIGGHEGQSFLELVDLYFEVVEDFYEFEGGDATLCDVGAVYAVEAVGADESALGVEHFHFVFDSVHPEGGETAVVDGFCEVLLQEGVHFGVVLVAAGGVHIKVGVPHLAPHLLLDFALFA